jgi:hypothetical protein
MGRMQPQWGKTRDELITSLLARQHQLEHERKNMKEAGVVPKTVKEDVPNLLPNASMTVAGHH